MKNVRNLIDKELTYNSRMAIIEKNTETGGTRPAVSQEGRAAGRDEEAAVKTDHEFCDRAFIEAF